MYLFLKDQAKGSNESHQIVIPAATGSTQIRLADADVDSALGEA